MRTIGVLGGLGPQATMDFEERVHRAARRLIPQRENSGYPPMVVYYHRRPPILLNDDGSPRLPIEPDPGLLDAAKRLGTWADFLVIVSNSAHVIRPRIEEASGRRVLSMIDLALDEVRRRGWRRVGVLGLRDPVVYTAPLARLQIGTETLGDPQRRELDAEIFRVMEGRTTPGSHAVARAAVRALRARQVDGIILGCTEIPLLLQASAADADLLDPLELLAEGAVRLALTEDPPSNA